MAMLVTLLTQTTKWEVVKICASPKRPFFFFFFKKSIVTGLNHPSHNLQIGRKNRRNQKKEEKKKEEKKKEEKKKEEKKKEEKKKEEKKKEEKKKEEKKKRRKKKRRKKKSISPQIRIWSTDTNGYRAIRLEGRFVRMSSNPTGSATAIV